MTGINKPGVNPEASRYEGPEKKEQFRHRDGAVVGTTATATTFSVKGEPYPHRVFDRAGLPCGNCATEIAVDRSGQDGHLTWYCPACQNIGREPQLFGST